MSARRRRGPVAAIAAALLLTAAAVPAAGGERAPASRAAAGAVGNVTRTKGLVTVGRGIPVVKKANLRGGDLLTTGPSGEARITLRLKRFNCTVWSSTQLRVNPTKTVGYQIVNADKGDIACATLSRSRQTVSVRGPKSSFTISMRDPVFSVSVRRKQTVVKVSRGLVVLSGRGGMGKAVLLGRGKQSTVPAGGDPRPPVPIKPTARERAAFARLERMLPKLQDTSPPAAPAPKGPPEETTSTRATFAFGTNDPGVSFSCSLDGGPYRVCTSPVTFDGLANGRHTLRVRATDEEGNTGEATSTSWTVRAMAMATSGRKAIARDATDVELEVDDQKRALVTFRAGGKLQRVLAWGAVNARMSTRDQAQVGFELAVDADPVRNVCKPYTGPPLAWLVAACTAPDGSHWALQQWQRGLPNYGVKPTAAQATAELRLSHWSGPIAVLEIKTDWSYRKYDHLYGRLTYRGQAVFGFESTASGSPLDPFGRNLFVDTLDSAYGSGWRRDNSFLTHRPRGQFCYGFYPRAGRPAGKGTRYRVTVGGPGVTPDIVWEGPSPGPYDAARDQAANLEQKALLRGDKLCTIN